MLYSTSGYGRGVDTAMSVHVEEKRLIQAEDLQGSEIPEKFGEIIEGEVIVMTPAGKYHNRVASNVELLFRIFCADRPELDFGGDNEGFLVRRNPDTLLCPDVSLYRRRPEKEKTWLEFESEIAVEGLSASNSPAELVHKRHTYFDAGTEQFWVVDLERKRIEFHHCDGRVVTVTGEDAVDGEGIAAGLRIRLPEVFRER